MIHIPSDLIVAYDPGQIGSLIGDKINSAIFDNSKIKRFVPDFVCEVPWRDGVRRALRWFQEDAFRQTIDHAMNEMWDRIIAGYEKAYP
jgi:hypothetical protein